MEPILENLVLHPALLIVSGFESLTSEDVRFLNGYRAHFDDRKDDMDKTRVYDEKHFQLGGILNPHHQPIDPQLSLLRVGSQIPNFPYLTKRDIWYYMYAPRVADIFEKLLMEIFFHLRTYSVTHKRPTSFFTPNVTILRCIEKTPAYSQVASLHMCGLGHKLGHAFSWVFEKFRVNEDKLTMLVHSSSE